jgi:hypothetical protein
MKLDAERHGMEPAICNMLESRNIITTLSGEVRCLAPASQQSGVASQCQEVGMNVLIMTTHLKRT